MSSALEPGFRERLRSVGGEPVIELELSVPKSAAVRGGKTASRGILDPAGSPTGGQKAIELVLI